jgi:hypothetical protein
MKDVGGEDNQIQKARGEKGVNKEFMTKYKAPYIVNVVRIRRMEWLGPVVRMNETRSVKKTFEGKSEGRRRRGRPRLRWINDVEEDLRKLGVK